MRSPTNAAERGVYAIAAAGIVLLVVGALGGDLIDLSPRWDPGDADTPAERIESIADQFAQMPTSGQGLSYIALGFVVVPPLLAAWNALKWCFGGRRMGIQDLGRLAIVGAGIALAVLLLRLLVPTDRDGLAATVTEKLGGGAHLATSLSTGGMISVACLLLMLGAGLVSAGIVSVGGTGRAFRRADR